MKFLQAIIFFDLDNTLVHIKNSHNFFDNIIVQVFNEFNIPPPVKEERDRLWRNSDYKQLLRSWNFLDPVKFWISFDKLDLEQRKILHAQGDLRLFGDVIPTLVKLKELGNTYLLLITNSSLKIARFELDAFGLDFYFQEILALGDSQEECKPNPGQILLTLQRLSKDYKFDKRDVYIVGDSPFDISAGKNAKINSIWVKRWEKSHKHWEHKPDYIIDNLEQLFSILDLT
ncbi:MAG: HAD family hydrolase [Candidatus Lokiarchaeota archaeon]|nr:HAD family hydrolase [Candidatus Lokiarchaeota archaeon]